MRGACHDARSGVVSDASTTRTPSRSVVPPGFRRGGGGGLVPDFSGSQLRRPPWQGIRGGPEFSERDCIRTTKRVSDVACTPGQADCADGVETLGMGVEMAEAARAGTPASPPAVAPQALSRQAHCRDSETAAMAKAMYDHAHAKGIDPRQLFFRFDTDSDGRLTRKDWLCAVQRYNFPLGTAQAGSLFDTLSGGRERMEFQQFSDVFNPSPRTMLSMQQAQREAMGQQRGRVGGALKRLVNEREEQRLQVPRSRSGASGGSSRTHARCPAARRRRLGLWSRLTMTTRATCS